MTRRDLSHLRADRLLILSPEGTFVRSYGGAGDGILAGAYFGQMMGDKDLIFAVDGEKDPVRYFEEGEETVEGDLIVEQNGGCGTVNIQ